MIAVATKRPTLKFWNTKTNKQRNQTDELIDKNPALLAVLTFASWYAWRAWQKKLTITSVWREHVDPNGMHQDWRAVDCRVYDAGRDGVAEKGAEPEITASEWQELCAAINKTFSYGRTWLGRKTDVAIYRNGGSRNEPAPHVHIQTKKRSW